MRLIGLRSYGSLILSSLIVTIVAWSAILGGLAAWQVMAIRSSTHELALNEARANFRKDQAFRFWAASHGGVYVPVTEHTPPNPGLAHVPERDISTPSGRQLTLMNPAYLVRQLNTDYGEFLGIESHISSLRPIRPGNSPDAWERRAILAFNTGELERVETVQRNGEPHLRLMRPMHAEARCLKCHTFQGYKVGDVLGGVSITIPLKKYSARENVLLRDVAVSYGAIWLFGIAGFTWGGRRLVREDRTRHEYASCQAKMAAIGQLAAGVAHEINNPLGFISSNLHTLGRYAEDLTRLLETYDRLLSGLPDDHPDKTATLNVHKQIDLDYLRDDLRQLIRETCEGAERVRKIVMDLKNYARQDDNTWEMASVSDLMERSLTIVHNELKYKADIIKEYAAVPPVHCLPGRIEQVLINLLVNAAQAIRERGRITVRTGSDQENVWVEVEDTGSGIAPEHMARLFEPFFTTKPPGQGTGLGLSVSYAIVQAHGGAIHVKSSVGRGTTFRVTLPLAKAQSE